MLIGDIHAPYKMEIERFHTSLATLAEIAVFVALGLAIVGPSDVWDDLPKDRARLRRRGRRPAAGRVPAAPTHAATHARELFIAWGGLKGAVPILLAAIALVSGAEDSLAIYNIVFIVVLVSVLVQGSTIPYAARRLGIPIRIVEPEPFEVSIGLREPGQVQHYTVGQGSRVVGSAIKDLPLGERAWVSFVVQDGQALQARLAQLPRRRRGAHPRRPGGRARAQATVRRPARARRRAGLESARCPRTRPWEGEPAMAKVLCVLYDDPVDGYPESYARDAIPRIERYHDGQTTPSPSGSTSGRVSSWAVSREAFRASAVPRGARAHVRRDVGQGRAGLRLRTYELPDAEIVISQPFWPAYLTAERIASAPELGLAVTAGIGSDHVDLQAAIEHGITVTEVTYSSSISVSEHVVMMILSLVRNYIPSYQWVVRAAGTSPAVVERSYDLEGMQVGTVAAGRIGSAVLRRLKPFEVGLHYTDRHRLPEDVERELGVTFHPDVESLVEVCDVVTINAPLHPETEHMFDDALIAKMKRGAYIVSTARGRSATAMRLRGRWRAASSPGTPETSGSRSRLPRITRGARCRTTG